MNKKLWIKLFVNITVIFAVFVIILAVANSTLLESYYISKEKRLLIEKSATLSSLDVDDSNDVKNKISEISDKYNFDIEIYEKNGKILYTTKGSQVMDFIHSGFNKPNFAMSHEDFETIKRTQTKDGAIIERAISKLSHQEFLLCKREVDGAIIELRTHTTIMENSAVIASEFITIIAVICLALSIIWILVFVKKFTKPITEMSRITEEMSELNFSKRVCINSYDEIGQLGVSINNLSEKLDTSLKSLREANEKLADEIELERRLDVMRKAFVANVSHELKTPLSVISGYAEGLKLNVNSESKNKYCDTIIDEAARMNKLVLSILELSKYESGQAPINNEVFDICEMANNMLNRLCENKKHILTEFNLSSPLQVYGDMVSIEQCLKSYLENALAHTEINGKITISYEDLGSKFKIKIENTGEKIPADIMPNIWQSFWRADKAHCRNEGRFGLGLSIVSAIVKISGNSCGVYNTEDGVCFWFTVDRS